MPIASYVEEFGIGPHKAADAVVITKDKKILLIRRLDTGVLALPGGFIEKEESAEQTSKRECFEETGAQIYSLNLERSQEFKNPDRDPRAIIQTTACLYFLPKNANSYPVNGADDAKEAFFDDLSKVIHSNEKFFADHQKIIKTLTKNIEK